MFGPACNRSEGTSGTSDHIRLTVDVQDVDCFQHYEGIATENETVGKWRRVNDDFTSCRLHRRIHLSSIDIALGRASGSTKDELCMRVTTYKLM
jgi:hypothetical protein